MFHHTQITKYTLPISVNVTSCMGFRFFTDSKRATSNLYLIPVFMIYYSKIAPFYFMITPKVTSSGRHFSKCLCLLCFPVMQSQVTYQCESGMQPGPSELQPHDSNQTVFSIHRAKTSFFHKSAMGLHSPTHD